ncbi:hypothetical protein [Streptomyces sp. NPDC006384]|uniref:hypothetical protein n=1 Tax=Streptomyces sp. NPDC006384 TaxID=3364745 RepID=UPI003693E1CC
MRESAAVGIRSACPVFLGRTPTRRSDVGPVTDTPVPLLADPDPDAARRALGDAADAGGAVLEPL